MFVLCSVTHTRDPQSGPACIHVAVQHHGETPKLAQSRMGFLCSPAQSGAETLTQLLAEVQGGQGRM